jgi:hypothetical protein
VECFRCKGTGDDDLDAMSIDEIADAVEASPLSRPELGAGK